MSLLSLPSLAWIAVSVCSGVNQTPGEAAQGLRGYHARAYPSPLGAAARTPIEDMGRRARLSRGLWGGRQKGICRNNFLKNVLKVLILLFVPHHCPTHSERPEVTGNYSKLEDFLTGSQASPSPDTFCMSWAGKGLTLRWHRCFPRGAAGVQ